MSKILVIENQKEFRERLNVATIDSVCVVADVMGLLKDYEEDAIEFEAEIDSPHDICYKGHVGNRINLITGDRVPIKHNDKLKVFAIRKEKQ